MPRPLTAKDNNRVYRAAITRTEPNGQAHTWYEGPGTRNEARASITYWKWHLRDEAAKISGHVEEAAVVWVRAGK